MSLAILDLYSARSHSPIPPPMPSPQLLPQPLPSPPKRRPSTAHSSPTRTSTSPTSPRFPLDRALFAIDPVYRSRPAASRTHNDVVQTETKSPVGTSEREPPSQTQSSRRRRCLSGAALIDSPRQPSSPSRQPKQKHGAILIRSPPVPPLPNNSNLKPVRLQDPPRKQPRHSTATSVSLPVAAPDYPVPDAMRDQHIPSSPGRRDSRSSRAGIMSPILRSFKSLPNVRSPKPDSSGGESTRRKHTQR